jgi:hypothetical protein
MVLICEPFNGAPLARKMPGIPARLVCGFPTYAKDDRRDDSKKTKTLQRDNCDEGAKFCCMSNQ